jgi:molybdenum cofactor biosynthesis enzyme MoaA
MTQDAVAAKLSSQLVEKFTTALGSELQKKQVLAEIQTLLHDFLEEVKINYVQRLSQEDIDQIIEQTKQMRSQVQVIGDR